MMYDKLQKSKPAVTKKVSEAPKMLKAGSSTGNNNTETIKKQKAQLRNSGRVRDAAALFEQFLE
jgi:RNA polymerase-interacting CarD/CdnL/TRCF family regulator